MNNKIFLLVVFVLVILISVFYFIIKPSSDESLSNDYESEKFGIRFSYPKNYFIASENGIDGERIQHAIVLIEDTPENREFFANQNLATESPPTITISIFQNNLDNYTLKSFVEGTSFSNFKLSDGKTTETTIGGEEALKYRATGLYENENVVAVRPNYVYMFTVFFNAPTDRILSDFETILQSVEFFK